MIKKLLLQLTVIKDLLSDNNSLQICEGSGSCLMWLVGVILIASILYLAYHRWIVPEHIKNDEGYKKQKYKDIDGC
ncbi:hypothetical protein BMS3Abin04_02194 [bacterium BMS3Abin04]|nr:hypothetical protein BMS3Abin04_02194 [bacterium BMS3Abin04]